MLLRLAILAAPAPAGDSCSDRALHCREALAALEQFEPAAASAPVDAAGVAEDESRGKIEDESSLENGTIVNMQVHK